MRALIVGYGSMGRRRIRIIKELIADVAIICVDSNPVRQEEAKGAGYKVYGHLSQIMAEKPDIAFVCTPPGHHAEIILYLVNAGIHVFSELNLIDDYYEEIHERSLIKDVKVFMSSTLLYDRQIEEIGKTVRAVSKPLTYIYHVGQYLLDWHPWESYKDFFIGQKETNGVREIFAIQLPWIIDVFGKIDTLSAFGQKCTELDIEFDDSITVNIKHKNGTIGVFVADVVSRKTTTSLEIIGEDLHLFWNGHNDDLFIYDLQAKQLRNIQGYESEVHVEGYADTIIENQYKDEVRNFLDVVYKGAKPRYSLKQDKYTISIINQIERLKQ